MCLWVCCWFYVCVVLLLCLYFCLFVWSYVRAQNRSKLTLTLYDSLNTSQAYFDRLLPKKKLSYRFLDSISCQIVGQCTHSVSLDVHWKAKRGIWHTEVWASTSYMSLVVSAFVSWVIFTSVSSVIGRLLLVSKVERWLIGMLKQTHVCECNTH